MGAHGFRGKLILMGKAELKIEIDADLLAQAEASGRTIAELIAEGLRSSSRTLDGDQRAERWTAENAEAINAHRQRLDQHGVFGEDLRTW